MARSPGFYYNEVDNTAYLNNNIEAAKVGTTVAVIGYASKGEFNTPVEITSYSNFVKKFGEPIQDQYSGMAVKRILNNGGTVLFVRVGDDNALESNVIIKNGNPEVKSKIVFNKSDVKNSEEVYDSGKIYIAKLGNKLIKVKTSVGRGISRANLINSIKNSLKETKAYTEYEIGKKQFSFNIVNSNDESVYGPHFVDLASAKTSSDRLNALNNAIKNSANYYRIVVKGDNGQALTNSSPLGILSETDSNYGFKLGDKKITVSLNYSNTIDDLKAAVDEALRVAELNNVVFKFVNDNKDSYFLLYSKTGEDLNFGQDNLDNEVKPLFDNDANIENIPNEIYGEIKVGDATFEDIGINSIVLKNNNKTANDITFKYNDGTFVLENSASSTPYPYYVEPTDYEFLDNAADCATLILKENFSERVDYNVTEENKKIVITTDTTNKVPLSSFDEEYNDNYVGNLLDLFVEDDIEYIEGKTAVPDEDRDMIKVSSIEKGSSTKGIVFEVVENTNAFDGTKTNDIYVRNGNNVESFLNVSFKEGDERYFVNVINQTAENGGSRLVNVGIKRPDGYNTLNEVELKPGVYVLGQPKDKDSVINETASDRWDYDYQIGTNGIAANEEEAKAYFCGVLTLESDLANDDLYDFDILITPDCTEEEVQTAAIELCESTMGAIYIADTPIALDKEAVIDWHNGKGDRSSAINSTYAAVYWPWLKVYDDISGKNVYVMPSVLMAAQYVFTDKVGPWNAPAGTSYGSIPAIDIERYPNRLDRDDLYTNGNVINPFKKYNDGTILAFGEKTTQRIDSTLSKIHTRRTLIRIRKELKAVLNGFIFKQGIAENVKLMKAYATTILDKFKSNKAIATYRVDTSRNTTASMQQDIIYVDVFVTPVGCIEEVNISFTLDKGNETVN